MPLRNYIAPFLLFTVVLSACTTHVRAPVYSRGTAPEPPAAVMQPPGGAALAHRQAAPEGYVVRRGDTLYSIAWQHGLEVEQLARINGLRTPYTIYPGQRLRTRPGPAPPRAAPLVRSAPLKARPLPQAVPPPADAKRNRLAPAPVPAAHAPPAAERVAEPPAYDGRWVWPTRGRVLRGYRENTNGKKGIDISGHPGQPVNAAAGGKVVYVGSGLVGYGRLIIIKHSESLLSAYGHNSKLLVADGDHVRAGQVIAKMGSSGTNRTALYFEIRKDGKPVDPEQYLPKQ